jgi:hypothetical protein
MANEMSAGIEERRQQVRNAVDFPVTVVLNDRQWAARCVNISAGGLRIRLSEPLPLWQRLALHFQIPGCEESFHVEGMALYATPVNGAENGVDAGIKFLGLSPAEGAHISRCYSLS